jgi:hypothetical protein
MACGVCVFVVYLYFLCRCIWDITSSEICSPNSKRNGKSAEWYLRPGRQEYQPGNVLEVNTVRLVEMSIEIEIVGTTANLHDMSQ